MIEHILKHIKIKKPFVPKIIFEKYTLYIVDSSNLHFSFYSKAEMTQIFTNFPTGSK